MLRIRWFASVIGFLGVVVVATSIHAQVIPKQSTDVGGQVTGKIMAIDNTAKTLTVKGPNNDGGVYATNSHTIIMNGDRTVSLGDLKTGWNVAVTSDNKDRKNVAQYITVVDTGN